MMWGVIQSKLCSGDLAGHGADSLLSSCAQPCILDSLPSPCVCAGVQDSPPSPCRGSSPLHCHRPTAHGRLRRREHPLLAVLGLGNTEQQKPLGSHGQDLLGTTPPLCPGECKELCPERWRAGARGSARFCFEERRRPHSALFGTAQRSLQGQVGTFPVAPTSGTLGPGPRGRQVAPGTHGRGRGYPGTAGAQVPTEGGHTGTQGR